jgi:hypothetical protein
MSSGALQTLSAGALALGLLLRPALAVDDEALTRMALCKDSWVDWSNGNPAKMKAFAERFRGQFAPHDNDPFVLPKANISVLGFRVAQAFPESVGMGVGFSLTIAATFDDTRKAAEKTLGQALKKCETSDGMRACALEIAPKRTVMLMAEDKPGAKNTLIGCYYFYEK